MLLTGYNDKRLASEWSQEERDDSAGMTVNTANGVCKH